MQITFSDDKSLRFLPWVKDDVLYLSKSSPPFYQLLLSVIPELIPLILTGNFQIKGLN